MQTLCTVPGLNYMFENKDLACIVPKHHFYFEFKLTVWVCAFTYREREQKRPT